jgi:hypothetical protein
LRRKGCGDHGIAITLEGRSEPSRSRISIDREPTVILSTLAAILSALPGASAPPSRLRTSVDCGPSCARMRFAGGGASMASRIIRSTASAAIRGTDPASSFRP